MWIQLTNGKRLYFPAVTRTFDEGLWLDLKTSRGRLVARVQICHIAAYWFDNETEAADD